MAGVPLTYTVFKIGECSLHQLHTDGGKFFVMGEVALELFQEPPTSFLQLRLPLEASASTLGVVLLPAPSVEELLLSKRRAHLVQPLRLALLKLATQEAARLMACYDFEAALPVALDAVRQGQDLFKPAPALQLFPLYLLAAQASLGLRRGRACEEFLALASWLVMKAPRGAATHVMRSQLARLYGQLYAFQGRTAEAVAAFAEDVYHCSCEYGPQDVRTSWGFYNLAKAFLAAGQAPQALAFHAELVSTWALALERAVLGIPEGQQRQQTAMEQQLAQEARARAGQAGRPSGGGAGPGGAPSADGQEGAMSAALPVGRLQLLEVVEMLQDVAQARAAMLGPDHEAVADTHFVAALALAQLQDRPRALQQLELARSKYSSADQRHAALLDRAYQRISSPLHAGDAAVWTSAAV